MLIYFDTQESQLTFYILYMQKYSALREMAYEGNFLILFWNEKILF